jgi:hypothetical protein
VGKAWILDTETKGTGASMVPLEKALKQREPAAAPKQRLRRRDEPATAPRPERPRKASAPAERTATALPAGHVRKKATGEIGRILSVDAKAGTANVHWLKRGAASTVPLTAISRR